MGLAKTVYLSVSPKVDPAVWSPELLAQGLTPLAPVTTGGGFVTGGLVTGGLVTGGLLWGGLVTGGFVYCDAAPVDAAALE